MENDYNNNYTPGSGNEPETNNNADKVNGTEENTTYHYSYKDSQNQNNTNYYTPQSENSSEGSDSKPESKKKERHRKVKTVEYDEFGNPVKHKKNKTAIIIIVIIAVCAVIGIAGLLVSMLSNTQTSSNDNQSSSSTTDVQTQSQNDVAKTDDSGNYTVAGIAEKCIDSCVGITVYTQNSSYGNFYGYGSNSNSQSSSGETASGEGSGIIMQESNGKTYILTCAHVISDGSSFKVTLNNGDEYDATMVGYDSQTDIGVLSINATGLQVAEFADSTQTVLGEQVVAIGCPGGIEFMNSVTSGYVSALDRPISSTIGYDNECIQIDAAINPGNSGGALFNMQGQVIGVNSSKIASTEYEGMGFAVPSNTAINTANSLIKVGYVEGRAKIGVTYTDIENYSNSEAILSALSKLGFENAAGTMVINQVSSDSDLAGKDVKEYDMIVAVNGTTMTDTDIMTSVLADSSPGDTIKLTIARIENNQIDTFEVDCKLIESKGNN
ncbi:MAG: trypsin-like peptidase domain-containing protein [Clostridiales bacterium]|nr:trypsin-like peptidase domain-containing protein [Clostridiales bacterium]